MVLQVPYLQLGVPCMLCQCMLKPQQAQQRLSRITVQAQYKAISGHLGQVSFRLQHMPGQNLRYMYQGIPCWD